MRKATSKARGDAATARAHKNIVTEYTPRAGRGRLATVPPEAYVGVENGNIPERYAHSTRNTSPHRKPSPVHVAFYGQEPCRLFGVANAHANMFG